MAATTTVLARPAARTRFRKKTLENVVAYVVLTAPDCTNSPF